MMRVICFHLERLTRLQVDYFRRELNPFNWEGGLQAFSNNQRAEHHVNVESKSRLNVYDLTKTVCAYARGCLQLLKSTTLFVPHIMRISTSLWLKL